MGGRRVWRVAVFAIALALPAAVEAQTAPEEGEPTLEYRPPPAETPPPKAPTPAPPKAFFKDIIGQYGISDGAFDRPVDLVEDREGNLFILDAGNQRIQVFDERGHYLRKWGSYGSRPGEFKDPQAIALDASGFLYVVDSGNHRVQKFERSGAYVTSFGSLGSGPGMLNNPADLTFDGEGNVWVVDAGNSRLQKFRFDAGLSRYTFVEEWTERFGDRNASYEGFVSVAWSREDAGYLYVLSSVGGCRVQQFYMRGELKHSWTAASPAGGLCQPGRLEMDNREDYLYVLDRANSYLLRYTRDGRLMVGFRGGERPFQKPRGFSVQQERQDIAVADTGNNFVQKFTLR